MDQQATDFERISFNFSIAKVLSIFLVVAGHYFSGTPLWVPVSVGLFVFAYSSAYFTASKYETSGASFWRNKAQRLLVPFLTSQLFLLLLFFVQQRDGIWTWQSVIHFMGMSGWLNWVALPNPSPFGAGLWFFTLLLVFYLLYPMIAFLNQGVRRGTAALVVASALALVLTERHQVGHMLWPTAFAFWFGVYAAKNPIHGKASLWLFLLTISTVLFVGCNVLGYKVLSIPALVTVSAATVIWLGKVDLHRRSTSWLLVFSPFIFEIYLTHTQLFVRVGPDRWLGFAASFVLICAVAYMLSVFSKLMGRIVFANLARA